MSNIFEYGYEQIRSFILSEWVYLELQDDSGTPLKRFGIADGLTVTGDESTHEIEYKVIVSGADVLFSGQSVGKSVLYDVDTGGTPIAVESFSTFTFEADDDELTIIHRLQVPQVN